MSRARDLADYVSTGVTSTELDKLDGLTATTDELNLVDGSVTGPLSHRNMIINGAMNVHQRGGTISYAHDGTASAYSLDRFKLYTSATDEWDGTVAQHTMSSADYNTTGFSKAFLLTTGTAESAVANDENASIWHLIEAQNLQHLQYGTASAKSVTLSFWVKSSVTGTYAVGLYKPDSTSRVINKTIAISDTNWNKYTLTFPGDTDSGATIANDNGAGIYVLWHLMSGSDFNDGANTSWENYASAGWAGGHAQNGIITTASATFYLTGVQLELGTVATPFEHKSYGDELARCQRYFVIPTVSQYVGLAIGTSDGVRGNNCQVSTPVTMRAAPTITSGTAHTLTFSQVYKSTSSPTYSSIGANGGGIKFNIGDLTSESTVDNQGLMLSFNDLKFTAEL
tara:strand:+ start:776 stop:1966 length:1191 start_codon:yes stop_codon:yes gene_type:complete